MTSATVAITGCGGLVGAQTLRRAAADYDVRAGLCKGAPTWHIDDLDAPTGRIDFRRPVTVRRFVRGAGAVLHCAGCEPCRALRVRRAKRTGVEQMRVLLDACATEGVQKVVYVSSHTTLGSGLSIDQPADETGHYVPGAVENAYFEAKGAMEAEVYRYLVAGLDVVIAIPTVVVGPGEPNPLTGAFLGAVAGGRAPVIPEGAMLNVVDARDVAAGVVAALRRGRHGRRYILGGSNVELSEFVDQIAAVSQRQAGQRTAALDWLHPVAKLAERAVEQVRWSNAPPILVPFDLARRTGPVSTQRAGAELGYAPRPLETTIRDTIQWLCRIGYLCWTVDHEVRRWSLRSRS